MRQESNAKSGRKLSELKQLLKNCNRCENLVKSRSQVVAGYGDFKASVLFIGEAPGRLGADKTGVPFTRDRSGRLLQRMLFRIGMNLGDESSETPILKDAYLTNIVKCNPRSSKGSNRQPSHVEIKNCCEYLQMEIKLINPKIIVPLGSNATKSILGEKTHYNFGDVIRKGNRYVLPLWHPAYIIRGGGITKINAAKYATYFVILKKLVKTLR